VAAVRLADQENEYLARVNGRRAVFLTVNQKEGTNILSVMEEIKKGVSDFSRKLPPAMKLYCAFDQSQGVRYRLSNFFWNLFEVLVLVGLIILLGEGVWAAGIVMTVIPLSIFIGIALIYLCGYGLEQMSITGLVIALGMIVDDAIVVTQNISRFIRNGHDRISASIEGTAKIAWPIVSSTLTTVFAFLPLVMMQDETGEYIRSMPLIVICTMMVSLLLALTLTPFLSSRFLPMREKEKSGRFQRGMDNWIEKRFGRFLFKALQRPKRVLLIAVGILVCSLGLIPFLGVSYFPKAEKPQFMININLPQGSNLDKTDRVARDVENILEEIKEIRTYASKVGRGNPQIHFSIQSPEYDLSFAQIFVELKKNDLRFMSSLIHGSRERFSNYPGAKIEVKEIELGPPVPAPIEIKLLGEKTRILTDLAAKAEKIFVSIPGTVSVKNPQAEPATDLAILINRDKAGMLGISPAGINTAIRACVAGISISRFRSEEGKEYSIMVRLPVDRAFSMADFDRIMVPAQSGAAIPLKQVAQIEFAASAKEISHCNFERSASITADVLPGYNVEAVTKAIVHKLEKLYWPVGYPYHVAGERESREDSFGGMGKASLFVLLAIFALLVLQFKSISQPLIVFAAIPLAVVGSILALLIFGYTFSFVAFIGLTTLFGIVIKCSIILVDYSNHLVKNEGMNIHEAVVESAKTRFVPIFLTTATTVLGLIPLALQGGTLFAPISLVMIGGLLTSSVLSLVVVPALYKIFTKKIS